MIGLAIGSSYHSRRWKSKPTCTMQVISPTVGPSHPTPSELTRSLWSGCRSGHWHSSSSNNQCSRISKNHPDGIERRSLVRNSSTRSTKPPHLNFKGSFGHYVSAEPGRGELASAQIEDIQHSEDHPDVRLIVLRNHKTARKTNKPRRIAIGKQLGEIINQAIGDRTSGPIFLSPKGHPWTTQRLS